MEGKDKKTSKNYFKAYGTQREKEAVNLWLDKLGIKRNEVQVLEEHRVGHDCVIVHEDGTETLVEVKNEEKYWYEEKGNITLDAISAFDYKDEVKNLIKNKYWVPVKNYDRFMEGATIYRWGSLYESDADVLVKRIIGTEFVRGYDMRKLREDADEFAKTYDLRINDKRRYKVNDNWQSATYCVKPEALKKYEINDFSEIPKRKRVK